MFPETTWSLITRLRKTAEHRSALTDLCCRYWRPVYLYVRSAWAKSDADASDLTQAFFLWLLEGEPLKRYAPERGGFRPYLKVLLRRFVGHQEVALKRLKRGGQARIVPIDDVAAVAPARDADPEALFDRAWVQEVVGQAVERVRRHFTNDGRADAFALYERYDLAGGDDGMTYASLAESTGVPVARVKHELSVVREAVRREIRSDLRQLTTDDRELEEEWRALFG